MNFLDNYVNKDIVKKINNKYNKKIITSIIYNQDNVIKVLEYFKNLGLDITSLLVNRLDIFLINIEILRKNIEDYDKNIVELLKNDISILDYLLDSVG